VQSLEWPRKGQRRKSELHTIPPLSMESKRVVKVDAHVLAYLGDYMKIFKESIAKQAKDILRKETKPMAMPQKSPRAKGPN